ncbi:hypothetical protein VTN02DRAFT_6671 [Thermoascus thermophilus]
MLSVHRPSHQACCFTAAEVWRRLDAQTRIRHRRASQLPIVPAKQTIDFPPSPHLLVTTRVLGAHQAGHSSSSFPFPFFFLDPLEGHPSSIQARHENKNFPLNSLLTTPAKPESYSTTTAKMAPSDELKSHATSSQDFYALLDISPAAGEAEIRRAYRRTALKYHPDKIANPTPADLEKFHLLQIAYDVLSDPAVRQLYDNAREARERKRRETELMDAAKRKMREDLEARERAGAAAEAAAAAKGRGGVKRPWMATGMAAGDADAEEKLEREIQRIAEDTRRRRREAEEKLRREAEEEERQRQREQEEAQRAADRSSQRVDRSKEAGGTNVPELERAVKVRWVREGLGLGLDKDRLATLFAPFGKVENAFTLKDKRQRVGETREKKTVATGVVVFASIVGAHAAVLDFEKKKRRTAEAEWAVIDSVFWASGNEPDLGTDNPSPSPTPPTPAEPQPQATTPSSSTPASSSGSNPRFNFPGLSNTTKKQPGKAPSFASFSSAAAAANAPQSAPSPSGTTRLGTPSLEEVTLMRLKNAQREKERRALEEQIRREDEAADAAEAAAAQAAKAG